jgi:hypothetical protein
MESLPTRSSLRYVCVACVVLVVGLRQVALLGQILLIFGPGSRNIALAGVDVEDGYALGGKDALNQMRQLRALAPDAG